MSRVKQALIGYNNPLCYEDQLYYFGRYSLLEAIYDGKFVFKQKAGIKWHWTMGVKCDKCGERCGIEPHPRYCSCGGDWKTIWKKEQLWSYEQAPLGLMLIFNNIYQEGGFIPLLHRKDEPCIPGEWVVYNDTQDVLLCKRCGGSMKWRRKWKFNKKIPTKGDAPMEIKEAFFRWLFKGGIIP